jgi:hypothetical protein
LGDVASQEFEKEPWFVLQQLSYRWRFRKRSARPGRRFEPNEWQLDSPTGCLDDFQGA